MRLQLITAALLAAMAPAASARGDNMAEVSTRAGAYQDSDRTTIITDNVDAKGSIGHVGAEARYLVDVISSASVDVITAATGRFHEIRHEAEGGLFYKDDDRKVSGAYIYSTENDWRSHTGVASFQQDFAHHNGTFKLAGSYVSNAVGRSGDANFRRHLDVGGGSASLTLVASPRDLIDVSYSLSYLNGYQASPYRFVRFSDPAGGPLAPSVPETDPNTRLRHAVTLRYNRAVFRDSAVKSHIRGYVDDWGVTSVTGGAEYVVGFGTFEIAALVRGYVQKAAVFYQPTYSVPQKYTTADRELSTFLDVFAGFRATYRKESMGRLSKLFIEAKFTGYYFRFFDFPRLPERTGLLAEAALGVSF